MPNYKIVVDYLIDYRARDLAKQTLQVVCPKLQIKPPALRWIADDDFGPKWVRATRRRLLLEGWERNLYS